MNDKTNTPKATFVDEKGNARDLRDLGLLTSVDMLNIAGGSDSVEILDARRAEHDTEKRVIELGQNGPKLNIYGDGHTHKPFPDIDECIDDTGLL